MKLWTIQPVEVFNQLTETGHYICDKTKSALLSDEEINDEFVKAYNWLVKKMIEKIGEPPSGVEYPVWAWHTRYCKHKKPDLRNCGYATPGEECVCIELEIPDELVVLSDFDNWHFVLNDWYLGDCTNEEEYDKESEWFESLPPEEQLIKKEKSWDKIFNTTYIKNDWTSNGEFIQATFWELKLEYVTNYWFFKAR